MKSAIACLLTLTLVIPVSARERTPLEQAQRIPVGSEVVISLKDKQVLTGRLGELNENSLTLRPFVPGETDRLVLFQDVKKITQRKEPSALHNIAVDILLAPLLPVLLLDCAFFENCLGWGP